MSIARLTAVTLLLACAAFAQQPLTLVTATVPNGAQSEPYSFQFTASGGSGLYSWILGRTTPVPGLSLSSSGLLSGTPTQAATYTVMIVLGDTRSQQSVTKNFTLKINSTIALTTTTLPNGEVGLPYSQQLAAANGVPPYSFAIAPYTPFGGAQPPPGLILNAATGAITGVPSVAGSYAFAVNVTDADGGAASATYPLTIAPQLTLSTTSPLPSATAGTPYSQTLSASGGAPPYMFQITQGTLPAGLALNSANGVVTGTPTAAGTSMFTIAVSDTLGATASKPLQITVLNFQPLLLVSPASLSFSASAGGDIPGAQIITILSVSGRATAFSLSTDSGQTNTPSPSWLRVTPLTGITPAAVSVTVDPSSLAANTYNARIAITVPGTTSQNPVYVPVAFTVSSAAPQLDVSPTYLRYAARPSNTAPLDQTLVVRNSGGSGPITFTVSIPNPVSWIQSITPTTGQALPNNPAYITVRVNAMGLAIGSYKASLQITSGATVQTIPISLYVSASGAVLAVDQTGLRLDARQGQGPGAVQTFQVLNIGDPASTVNFSASIANGANWIAVTPANGTATASAPATLTLVPNAAAQALASGPHYALVRVADANALNSPQYVTIVYNVADPATPAFADPVPQGILFTGTSAGPQFVTAYTNSSTPVSFTAAADPAGGGSWLSVLPAAGTTSAASPAKVTISVNPAGLAPGIYTGLVNIAIGSQVRSVNITYILPASAAASRPFHPQASAACAPSRVVLTGTGLVNNFSIPAGFPATLEFVMADDCGNSLPTGSAVARFSNGDPPLSLQVSGNGFYAATWQPGNAAQQTTITVSGTSGTLQPGVAQLTGGVSPNTAPVLFPNGIAHNYLVNGALSPGVIAAVFGTGLAAATGAPSSAPLPNTLNGTALIIGDTQVPLYFISTGQLDVQVPTELKPGQYVAVASAGGALTLPQLIDLNAYQAGVAQFPDGRLIAQHADFTLVDAANPAKPGEVLIIYISGLGATNPPVASGQPAPSSPLALLVTPATVTVDGNNANVIFAGLSPGGVGLYQIDFQVPANARSGSLPVVVSQNGVNSNTTQLPVSQ